MRGSLFRILRRRVIVVFLASTVVVSACSGDSAESAPPPAGPSADIEASQDDVAEVGSEESTASETDADGARDEEAEDRMTMATLVPGLPGPHVAIVVDDRACDGSFCRTVLELQADGQWSLRGADGAEQAGGFESQELVALASTLQVDDVVLGPFTGQCPTESGGSERFYRVFSGDAAGDEEPDSAIVLDVSTCSHQIDADAPVIVALDLLLAEVLNS